MVRDRQPRGRERAWLTLFALVQQEDSGVENTTLFVGGLAADATEADLAGLFQAYGALAQVRVPPGKNCGFVEYMERPAAEAALAAVHGHVLRGSALRLSWGRNGLRHARAPQRTPYVPDAAPLMYAADPAVSKQAFADGYYAATGTALPSEQGVLSAGTGLTAPPHVHPFSDPTQYDVTHRNAVVRSGNVPMACPVRRPPAARLMAAGTWQPP